MIDDLLNDPALNPPSKPDFRRVGKGVPLILDPDTGKMVRRRRSSSAGKVLDDESNLTDWKLRTVLVGAAQLPEVLAMVSTLDPEADKKAIRDHVEECLQAGKGNSRKVQGTAIHAMFDHVDLEHEWEPAPQFREAVNAYKAMLNTYGLVPIDVEVHCVNDQFGLAGTLDRRYRTTRVLIAPDGSIIPIGSILVGDTKTGLSLEYASGTYATQLAAYVDSVRYDVVTDERAAFDPPNYPDWALVVHAVPERKSCDLYWVDIGQGRKGLNLAHQVWEWRRSTGLISPSLPPTRMAAGPPVEPQEPFPAVESPPVPQQAPGAPESVSLDDLKQWLKTRVLAVVEHSELATQQLRRKWPEGMLGLRHDGQTFEQLCQLERVLDKVETDHSLPFGDTDPRVIAQRDAAKGRHPSNHVPEHPRAGLLAYWADLGQFKFDGMPVAVALQEFARLPAEVWPDADLSLMLDGTLRALGYEEGVEALSTVKVEDATGLMSAAFAVAAGTAWLMFDADDKPITRFNVVTTQ